MAKSAREKIAAVLLGDDPTGSFSVETSASAEGVTLSVDQVGSVTLPVGAPQERQLVSVARPAMFGLGEQTLIDTSVRDTWELTAEQVRLGGAWRRVLDSALSDVHEGLGLPRDTRLRAEPHALLVYGPDQFFAAHQDSEKDDEMVATLVVSLPSVHTGGELVVSHAGETRTYRHSDRDRIGFVAFYTDCVHEVRPVRSGRRVTMTFNLLASGDGADAPVDPDVELDSLVREHFATPTARRWSDEPGPAPDRLVVLLDHQYSERGLAADRFKGRDVEWVRRLRTSAERTGCESALALADIRQTWSADEDNRPWEYGYTEADDEDDENGGYDDDESASYALGDLIDDEMSLSWWKRAAIAAGEQISLGVDDDEVCAVTPTASLVPYESQYEGYMGNYGNTLDRWYRRAAILLWPKERDFVVRAEADLPHALAELAARLDDGDDLDRVRADARQIVAFVGARSTDHLAALLSIADRLDDADLAHDLLAPHIAESLTVAHAAPLAEVTSRYGDQWTRNLVDSWFATGRYGRGRWEWVTETLPDMAIALKRRGAAGVVAHVCRRVWTSLSISIAEALAGGPRSRARSMASLAEPAAAIFRAADTSLVEELVGSLTAYEDGVLDLELPLLRRLGPAAPPSLADDAVRRLTSALERPPRQRDDWSITWSGCGCTVCATLQEFLDDPSVTALDWPLRTDGRQHVHQRIESAELPVTHQTIRKGRPYTLRLTKQPDLHQQDAEARRRATADLSSLRGQD